MILALEASGGGLSQAMQVVTSVLFFVAMAAATYMAYEPLKALILRQEQQFGTVLRSTLLLDVKPRAVTLLCGLAIALLGGFGYLVTENFFGVVLCGAAGAVLPPVFLRMLRRRRLRKLEDQLVGGIVTLASGVRAGLNLVQAMELVSRDGPTPLRQEFAHLVREYEYGVPLEQAMDNAGERIGSGDFKLLFAALETHRERGGDLGETLDRIADSIREIQRLEKRVETLTAQGRATARWLGAMPVVIGIIYYFIDPAGVMALFEKGLGNLILLGIIILNILGFLWIKKIVSIDI
jgi:tight adherence protein B